MKKQENKQKWPEMGKKKTGKDYCPARSNASYFKLYPSMSAAQDAEDNTKVISDAITLPRFHDLPC